jgi:hypothetical protein
MNRLRNIFTWDTAWKLLIYGIVPFNEYITKQGTDHKQSKCVVILSLRIHSSLTILPGLVNLFENSCIHEDIGYRCPLNIQFLSNPGLWGTSPPIMSEGSSRNAKNAILNGAACDAYFGHNFDFQRCICVAVVTPDIASLSEPPSWESADPILLLLGVEYLDWIVDVLIDPRRLRAILASALTTLLTSQLTRRVLNVAFSTYIGCWDFDQLAAGPIPEIRQFLTWTRNHGRLIATEHRHHLHRQRKGKDVPRVSQLTRLMSELIDLFILDEEAIRSLFLFDRFALTALVLILIEDVEADFAAAVGLVLALLSVYLTMGGLVEVYDLVLRWEMWRNGRSTLHSEPRRSDLVFGRPAKRSVGEVELDEAEVETLRSAQVT